MWTPQFSSCSWLMAHGSWLCYAHAYAIAIAGHPTLTNAIVVLIIGVAGYNVYHFIRDSAPPPEWHPDPLPLLHRISGADLDALIERCFRGYSDPILEPYKGLSEKTVRTCPPPPDGAQEIERFISTNLSQLMTNIDRQLRCNPFIEIESSPFHATLSYFIKYHFRELLYLELFNIRTTRPSLIQRHRKPPRPAATTQAEMLAEYDKDESRMTRWQRRNHRGVVLYATRLHEVRQLELEEERKHPPDNTVFAEIYRPSREPQHPFWQDAETVTEKVYSLLAANPVLLPYSDQKRFERTQLVGSSGAGKTNLLSHLILFDLHQDYPPGLILIDPKRVMIDKLSRLALFNDKLKDRLLVISTQDRPALNIFDTTGHVNNAGAIDAVVYLCSVMGTDFTGKQRGLYRNLAGLPLRFPRTMRRNATLEDLHELTAYAFPPQYKRALEGLEPIQRRFFESGTMGFESRDYRETKDQIRARLNTLIGSTALSCLFTSQHSAANIFAELQKGSIILINCSIPASTDDDFSEDDVAGFGSIFFSRLCGLSRNVTR